MLWRRCYHLDSLLNLCCLCVFDIHRVKLYGLFAKVCLLLFMFIIVMLHLLGLNWIHLNLRKYGLLLICTIRERVICADNLYFGFEFLSNFSNGRLLWLSLLRLGR